MKRKGLYFTTSLLAAFIVLFSCKTTHEVKDIETKTSQQKNDIEHGKKIVSIACGPCHLDQSTNTFSGSHLIDAPPVLGQLYASSLTKNAENEVNKYTDGQLKYLLRTGIKKDGKMAPFMQKPNMSDEDLNAIITFLRSDDPMVQANDVHNPRTKYSAIGNMVIGSQKPLKYPETTIFSPNKNDKVAYGKYLIDIIGCYDCHSANIMKTDKLNPEKSKGYMGGGTKMLSADGSKIVTSNLTFHETGLANYTVQDFGRAVRQGINKENKVLRYPMRMFTDLNDDDIEAIYTYLKTVPPINNPDKNPKSKKKD
ncbi:MAG: cytochrome c [Sphingobacteriales bacterium]|nr:MAG: cytochrome c [Sphingobacteriales bacterium]